MWPKPVIKLVYARPYQIEETFAHRKHYFQRSFIRSFVHEKRNGTFVSGQQKDLPFTLLDQNQCDQ